MYDFLGVKGNIKTQEYIQLSPMATVDSGTSTETALRFIGTRNSWQIGHGSHAARERGGKNPAHGALPGSNSSSSLVQSQGMTV